MVYFDYLIVLIFFLISVIIAVILLLVSYLFSVKEINHEKLSAYECGFEPFEDTRNPFEIKFFLVGILFLIFDLEILYLVPWVLNAGSLEQIGLSYMVVFFIIVTVGFIYEWDNGALDWTPDPKK